LGRHALHSQGAAVSQPGSRACKPDVLAEDCGPPSGWTAAKITPILPYEASLVTSVLSIFQAVHAANQ